MVQYQLRRLEEHLGNIITGAKWFQETFGNPPKVVVFLGSAGIDLVPHFFKSTMVVQPLPSYFPQPTTPGHHASVMMGVLKRMGRKGRVLVVNGRSHFYEHGDPHRTVMLIRTLIRWGCENIILTNMVGATNPELVPGEMVVITDHNNAVGSMCHPLIGNTELMRKIAGFEDGEQVEDFPHLQSAYSSSLIRLLRTVPGGDTLNTAVLGMRPGRELETPAEAADLWARGIGVVGMSSIPEAIAAAHMRLCPRYSKVRLCTLSVVSNASGAKSSHASHLASVRDQARVHGNVVAGLARAIYGY